MARQEIAVVGGGAKAAAIAAKAWSLREARVADIHVTVFEKATIGSHWDGNHGYTDGHQLLCTPAERDLGFPYDSLSFGEDVAAFMQMQFSWMAYTVLEDAEPSYADWVNRGRDRPTHAQFAAYLREAVDFSEARVVTGEVTSLRFGRDWTVGYETPAGERFASGFDGVVVTSPGPQRRISTLRDPRLFMGDSFWQSLPAVRALATGPDGPVIIAGAGGTAAAIAAWLLRNGFDDREIFLIADQPTLYSRSHNFFENRVFTDDATWQMLTPDERGGFNRRLTQGVVWDSVSSVLAKATNLDFLIGRVSSIELGEDPGDGSAPELVVALKPRSGRTVSELPAAVAIDASGFQSWWFLDLLEARHAAQFDGDERNQQRAMMAPDLSFAIPDYPRLHAPFLADAVGPGFTSLMALGAMSDHLLSTYAERSLA